MTLAEYKAQMPKGSKLIPILFNTEMVKAILEGRKTQTRRTIKPQPFNNKQYSSENGHKEWFSMNGSHNDTPESWLQFCPYGKPGDILWVRETWATDAKNNTTVYKASADVFYFGIPSWTPNIHMPFEKCRIFLKVKSVRVETIQSISREDAAAEGVCFPDGAKKPSWVQAHRFPEQNFANLWQSVYGEESWNANPWVWVIEFERI